MKKEVLKINFLVILSLLCLTGANLNSQSIGSPGWSYDSSGKVNNFYESKQKKWATAGIVGGIRNPATRSRNVPNNATTQDIQNRINSLSNDGGGVLKFPAKTFNITKTLFVKKNVVLQGSSSGVTTFKDKLSTNNSNTKGIVLKFDKLSSGHTVGGIRNITFNGPLSGTPVVNRWKTDKPKVNNIMINIVRSNNIFLDNVKIINSGGSPISTFRGGHHTFRNCLVRGVWNKGGGGQGYFNISSSYCLVYNCTIEHLRHFAIQQGFAEYNVVFDNIINQDVNFHNDDLGNNLIERNNISIAQNITGSANNQQRFVVMGPWDNDHTDSRSDNYVYNNTVFEYGRSNPRCKNKARVYRGARGYEPGRQPGNNPFSASQWIGRNKRLYAVKNGNNTNKSANEKNETIASVNSFKVYPNPLRANSRVLNIEIPERVVNPFLFITDIQGKIVYQEQLEKEEVIKSLKLNQKAGLYFVKIQGENQVFHSKLILE